MASTADDKDGAPKAPAARERTGWQGKYFWSTIFFIAVVIAIWWSLGDHSKGFSDEQIETTKASIKSEFEKRPGTEVIEVYLMRKTPDELTGFAKLKLKQFDLEITKSCTVTRESGDSGRYMWSCQ